MFDDQTPPANLPTEPAKEPEDIFDRVEPAPSSTAVGGPFLASTKGVLPAASIAPVLPPAQVVSTASASAPSTPAASQSSAEIKQPLVGSRRVIIAVGIIVGIAIVAAMVFGVLRFVRRTSAIPLPADNAGPEATVQPETPSLPEASSSPQDIPGLPAPAPAAGTGAPEVTPVLPVQTPVDSDGDSLSDSDEASRGTEAQNPDSDNDGLFDGEEVNAYGTDPLDSDTDGDSYLDGQEVRNGFNPKGPGKLFTVPSQ